MRVVKIVVAVVVGVGIVLGAGLVVLQRYLQSPAFKQAVLTAAHDALGSDLRIGEMHVSLFSGVTLQNVAIANPPGFSGDLLSTDALVVRYRLLPLLQKRLEVDQASLERPVLRLVRGPKGAWNYEREGTRSAPSGSRLAAPTPAPPEVSPPVAAGGLAVILPRLTVHGGEVAVTGERDKRLAQLQQVSLDTSVKWTGEGLDGAGQLRVDSVNVANALVVRQLAAPVRFSSSEIRLTPLHGALAQGELSGDLAVHLSGIPKYVATLQLKGADVEQLLAEAGNRGHQVIRGKLDGRAMLEGTGGLPTLVGSGRADLVGGRLVDVPALSGVAALLQVPGLSDLACQECRVEFTVADNVLRTPVIRLIAREVQVTGHGAVSLASLTLDHQLTLAVTKDVLRRVPREVRRAFTERSDGLAAVDFRVWGPYEAPKTDLQDRLLKGVTEQILRRGLQNLFK